MTKKIPLKYTLILSVIFGILMTYGALVFLGGEDNRTIESSTIIEKIHEIQELSLVQYNYTTVIGLKDQLSLSKLPLPFTEKFFLATYDGNIKAGISLKNASLERMGNRFTIILPHASITSHEMDEKSLVVYDESKNILNPIRIEDFNQAIVGEKEKMEQKAIQSGILTQTEQGAEKLIQEALLAMGIEEVKVEFR